MHGKIFRYDDPIWSSMYPPNGWNCRCFVRSLTEREVNKRGLKVDKSINHLSEHKVNVGGEEKTVSGYTFNKNGKRYMMKPDAGWSVNQGLFSYVPNLEKYDYAVASNISQSLVNSKVFDNFYNRCGSLAETMKKQAIKELEKQGSKTTTGAVENYAINKVLRRHSSLMKNTTFDIAVLNEEQKALLKTNIQTIKLSAETLIKERIKHNDVELIDFKKIGESVKNFDVLILKTDNNQENIIGFKLYNKFFMTVIKTTTSKNQNYLKTYHVLSKDGFKKELIKDTNKIIFNNLPTQ